MNVQKMTIICALVAVLASCATDSTNESVPDESLPPVEPSPSPVHLAGNPVPQKVRQPFTFMVEETGDVQLTVTVTKVTCGFKGFAIPADESMGQPAYDLWAPEGTRFCEVDLDVKNTGKRHTQFHPGGDMHDTDGNQFVWDEEATHANGNALRVGEFSSNVIELRPGQDGRSLVIFPIKIGSAPAYVLLHEGVAESIDGGRYWARIDIAPKDVNWFHPRGQ